MKLNIDKKIKIGLISILIILIGTSSILLYREVNYPVFEQQKVSVYSYNNKGAANYRVFLKPNILYETSSLDEGKLYMTEFIDYIKATFSYDFNGQREAVVQGSYDIIAKVQGFTGQGQEITYIWEKDFVIVPQKSFNIKGETKSIKEVVELRLDEYNTFARQIIEASKINSQTQLSIIMNVNLKGDTDKGPIEDTISPNMIIPLNTNMFQIGGQPNVEKQGVIEETNTVQLPVNKNKVIFFGVIISILSIILICLVFFTKAVFIKDPLEKKLKQIFKKHGDRFVALNSEIAITCDSTNQVKSIDDLVRIADEVGKPIMYKYSVDYKEIKKLYVTNEDEVYILDLDEIVTKDQLNITVENKSNEVVTQEIAITDPEDNEIEYKEEESKIES